jgi:hypothetical protein
MIPLQSYTDLLLDGKIFEAIIGGITSAVPLPVASLLVFGSIGAAYYLIQQRVIIPIVMLILVGGVTVARAPSGFGAGILGVMVLSLAGLVYLILQRVSTK